MIRLPGRGAGGGADAAGGGTGAGGPDDESAAATGAEDGTPGAEGGAGALVDEEVMGGGKPFRVVQGKVYVIEGDEFVTEDDAKGDTKIDKNGNLLGGASRVLPSFPTSPFPYPQRLCVCASTQTPYLRPFLLQRS
jgi:chromatin structure-remodeling complex protein RSC7